MINLKLVTPISVWEQASGLLDRQTSGKCNVSISSLPLAIVKLYLWDMDMTMTMTICLLISESCTDMCINHYGISR